jgi:hypothetical protein
MGSMNNRFTQILLKKQIGNIKLLTPLLKATKVFCIGALAIYIPMAAIAYTSNERTHTDQYAAILVSAHAILGNDHWLPPLALLGSYPSWTLYFNKKGLKTEYFLSATCDDFKGVLLDDKYQSVVLVGHGSYNHWRATDYNVSIFDVKRMAGKYSKKEGEWFQLSCATRDFSDIQLGELVMKSGRSYAYNGEAGTIHFVVDALTPFWIIKSNTKRRYEAKI